MSLTYADITHFADQSAAVRLLRGDHRLEDLAFFFHVFRGGGSIVVLESELRTEMEQWLNVVFADQPDRHPGWQPMERINFYVKQNFLRKREPSNSSEPVYELTSDIDRLLTWIEDQRRREFVGTEFGLQAIIRDLRTLAVHASGDWQKRRDELQARRQEIDREIEELMNEQGTKVADARYITENLQRLERSSHDLVGDFTLLRERFAELARDVAKQQSGSNRKRGETLRLALDGEDALRKTPMGESFYGFWRLVASSERDAFAEMIQTIYATPGLPEDIRARRSLHSLLDRLREQGQVVLDANRQLTRQLRHALDRNEIEERRLMSTRIADLRLLLLGHIDDLDGVEGIDVDTRANVILPTDRPLFEPTEPVVVETSFRDSDPADIMEAARQIAAAGLVDLRALAKNIAAGIADNPKQTGTLLSVIVDRIPPKEGILDILGYLHLAQGLGDDAHVMLDHTFIWSSASGRTATVPDVFFVSAERLPK